MVVRMRHTRSHTANRRSHHALKLINMVKCSHCSLLKKSHAVCPHCGMYRGKKMVDMVKSVTKTQSKKSQ